MKNEVTKLHREEMLEVAKLSYQDYEYKHRNFWELVYRSMLAILVLMAIPYFLKSGGVTFGISLAVFPAVALPLCVFSINLLNSEAIRMRAIRERMNQLLGDLSANYHEVRIADLYEKDFEKTEAARKDKKIRLEKPDRTKRIRLLWHFTVCNPTKIRITQQIILLYLVLIALCITEIVLLLRGVLF